jgi:hypothetical protein
MSYLKHRVSPTSPGIRRKARHYELKLKRILTLAARQDSRRSAVLATLYREARVEGINARMPARMAIIHFESPPFMGGLYEMYPWKSLDLFSERELADSLAWGLRENVRHQKS